MGQAYSSQNIPEHLFRPVVTVIIVVDRLE